VPFAFAGYTKFSRSIKASLRVTQRTRAVAVDAFVTVTMVVIVASPMLFTDSGFAPDFTNHLWLTWYAGASLFSTGHPGFFINVYFLGSFYPFFAFYGGTLYTLTGAVSEMLGDHPVIAFEAVTMLAIAGCYGGTLWLGRQFGLRGWIAHAPSLTVITSAYYITNLYGRGAWPELMAVSAIPPLLASGVHLACARKWRAWPILVFVVSGALFTGSHNITLLWGTTALVLGLLVIWLVLGRPLRMPYRRLALLVGLGLTSMLINAWFLLPDLAYQNNVGVHDAAKIEGAGTTFNTPAVLLNPLRAVPKRAHVPGVFVQVPDWFIIWGLTVGLLLLWRRRTGFGLRGPWLGMTFLVVLLLTMIMFTPFWSVIPYPFTAIQFPYRLDSYLVYAAAGLVLVAALALQRAGRAEIRQRLVRGLRLALVVVTTISLCLCIWQLWVPGDGFATYLPNRNEALATLDQVPHSWYETGVYNDRRAPIVAGNLKRILFIQPYQVHDDRFAAWMNLPPGPEPIQTNISSGNYLVHISGVTRLGRDKSGFAVVRRVDGGSGPVHVVVETAHSFVIELGRALSIFAILIVIAVLTRPCMRFLRSLPY
jgi:hypothetical protein